MSASTSSEKATTPLLDNQYFTLARLHDSSNVSAGGVLTLGEIPDVTSLLSNITVLYPDTVHAIVPVEASAGDDTKTLRFYTISVHGTMLPSFTNTSVPTNPYSVPSNTNIYLSQPHPTQYSPTPQPQSRPSKPAL